MTTTHELTDVQRAAEIQKRLDKVVSLTDDIMLNLDQIKSLMGDDYPDVARFETKDIAELQVVLKVAFRRNIYGILHRWSDNTVERARAALEAKKAAKK